MSENRDLKNPSRREAFRKFAVGAGAITAFPILGQASAMSHIVGMADAPAVASMPAVPDAEWKPLFFDPHQNETVIALTELIIPATDTPGAKAAQVNRYFDLVLNESESDRQKEVLEGLSWIDGRALKTHGKPFIDLTTEQQTALLEPLADPKNKNPEDKTGVRFFDELKGWTIFAYYSSEIGSIQELHYDGANYHTEFPGACKHPEHQS
ncbi:MAG: gluconate 2-dehydrogenase subunit 3 family protein [Terriglobia bacterium]